MNSKTFTVETRLEDSELLHYFKDVITPYNIVCRYVLHLYAGSEPYKESDSHLCTHVCNKFGITKRTANSILHDVKGKLRAYKELKRTERSALKSKIAVLEARISRLESEIDTRAKILGSKGRLPETRMPKYKRDKQKLFQYQQRLNRLKQKYANIDRQIKEGYVSLGYGTKKMFSAQYNLDANFYKTHEGWYNDYVRKRDKTLCYIGSKDETCGCQMIQLSYNAEDDNFKIKVRKDFGFDRTSKYAEEELDFKHLRDYLIGICEAHKQKSVIRQPLTYRVVRRGKKWYLQVMFSISYDKHITGSRYGVIGLDYNDGFIEQVETNEDGNILSVWHYDLEHHGTGNRATTEIETIISQIVNEAERKGKSVVIEDLDFRSKKAKQVHSSHTRGKQYNTMLHKFDYSRYTIKLENAAHRKRVELIKVNPAYTSQIGYKKYAIKRKLNRHQAAAYVIARRGQGFKDSMPA